MQEDRKQSQRATSKRQPSSPVKGLSLKQNLLWNTAGCLTYQACQWLTTILVVVLSSSYENSGILAFAMATGNVFVGLATYNVRTFQVADVDNRFSSENYVAFRIVTIIGASVLCIGYSLIVAPSLSTGIAMTAYLLFKADESFCNVLYGIDQKAERMDYIGISQGVRGIFSIAAFSGALVAGGSLTIAFIAMFASCAAVTLAYDLPHSRRLTSVRARITRQICTELLRTCAPNVVATFAYGFVATLARQWFGVEYGEEALGIYAAVATPCVLVQVMANYLYSPFLVPLARNWTAGDDHAVRAQLRKLLLGMGGVIAACLLLAAIAGAPAIELVYGPDIQDYSWMIVPAMVAASFMALDSLLTDLLIVMRRYFLAAAINVIALASCAALTMPFTDAWYMNGVNAVIATSFAIGIAVGLAAIFATRKKSDSRHQTTPIQ